MQALTCRLGAPAHLCDERAFSYPGRILRWYKEVDKDGKELSGYLWWPLFKTVSYLILEYTLLVALNDTLRGFILP